MIKRVGLDLRSENENARFPDQRSEVQTHQSGINGSRRGVSLTTALSQEKGSQALRLSEDKLCLEFCPRVCCSQHHLSPRCFEFSANPRSRAGRPRA